MKATKASTMDQRGMSVSSSLTEKDELESPRAMLTKNTLVEVRQQFRISELLKIIDFLGAVVYRKRCKICREYFYRTISTEP